MFLISKSGRERAGMNTSPRCIIRLMALLCHAQNAFVARPLAHCVMVVRLPHSSTSFRLLILNEVRCYKTLA